MAYGIYFLAKFQSHPPAVYGHRSLLLGSDYQNQRAICQGAAMFAGSAHLCAHLGESICVPGIANFIPKWHSRCSPSCSPSRCWSTTKWTCSTCSRHARTFPSNPAWGWSNEIHLPFVQQDVFVLESGRDNDSRLTPHSAFVTDGRRLVRKSYGWRQCRLMTGQMETENYGQQDAEQLWLVDERMIQVCPLATGMSFQKWFSNFFPMSFLAES